MSMRGLLLLLAMAGMLGVTSCASNDQFWDGIVVPRQSTGSDGESGVISRTINADGRVVIIYADGSKRVFSNGGWELIAADGTTIDIRPGRQLMEVPTGELPGDDNSRWLEAHGDDLLDIMRNLIGNDEEVIDDYQEWEDKRSPIRFKISRRTKKISELLFQPGEV